MNDEASPRRLANISDQNLDILIHISRGAPRVTEASRGVEVACIPTVCLSELARRADLFDATLAQHDHAVSAQDAREAVRDDERRAAFGSLRQALLDRALRRRVEGARRLSGN